MAVVVVAGVLAGYLSGGRLSSLAELRLRWLWLIPAAAAVALAPHLLQRGVSASVLVAGVLLSAFLIVSGVRQRRGVRAGLLLMLAGWLLNLVVVVLNGGMPTPPEVLDGDTWWPNLWLMPHLLEHVPLGGGTRLPWLADTIELRFANVLMPISAGDLLLYSGGVTFLCAGMRREGRD